MGTTENEEYEIEVSKSGEKVRVPDRIFEPEKEPERVTQNE